LRYAGQNSIVVYLAFFLPMATTRALLLKFAPGLDLRARGADGHDGCRDHAAAVLRRGGGLWRFLFKRPAWARLVLCLASHRRRKSRLSPLRVTRAGP
jgi:hypothetical protein